MTKLASGGNAWMSWRITAFSSAAASNWGIGSCRGLLFNQLTETAPHRLTPEELCRTLLNLIHTCAGPPHPSSLNPFPSQGLRGPYVLTASGTAEPSSAASSRVPR
ncbi:hypothetical protein ACFWBX_03070 [Streptomyces sp. NPDC059991]|uniref:hypothetical protein n=1 Tax=Streptomyces sp. NPDC059991 TaxID=3347028 RepID=UPI003685AA09